MFTKILIANRGEIACRVIKAAQEDGHRDRRGVLRGRQATRCTSNSPTRPCCIGPPPSARVLPRDADKIIAACEADRGARRCTRATASCPRTRRSRASVEEEAGIVFIGPEARVDRGDGRQDRLQEARRPRPGSTPSPATTRRSRPPRMRSKIAKKHRLPGDDQGLGRRRRQGPAGRVRRQGGLRGLHLLPQRGPQQLRRRPRLHREVRRGAAPHRDPGAGRRLRPLSSTSTSASARSSAATRR